jgi:hypothetical protein
MNPGSLADTGILIAVPLTQMEFRQRVQMSDWLGKFLPPDIAGEGLEAAIDERWRTAYSPLIAEPLQELVDLALRGGAEVRPMAGLADLVAMTREKHLVILFAHWKGPEVLYDDLIQPSDYDAFLSQAAQSSTSLGKWIASELRKRRSDASHDTLLNILNEALDECLSSIGDGGSIVLEHAVTRNAQRREELEQLFPGFLRAGNRLELFDGLHSKEVVESQVAPDFRGILDLTACTSTVLADYIAARRRHQLRTVQFPDVLEFIWAAKAVAGALQLTSSGNFDYLEARNIATGMLDQAIREAERT